MRKVSGLAAMAVLAVSGSYAHADSLIDGTFTFTNAFNIKYPLPTGSFVWDSTTKTWKSFTVDWDGAVFNFAKVFPDLADLATRAQWCGVAPARPTDCAHSGHFSLYTQSFNTTPEQATWTDLGALGYGGYTVKEVATTTTATATTAGVRECGRAGGRPDSDGDDGHDCARDRRRTSQGDVVMVRDADNASLEFEHREEAGRIPSELRARGDQFGLSLHREKPTLTAFGASPHSKEMATVTTAAPEPATLGLMVLGLLGAGFSGRRRRS